MDMLETSDTVTPRVKDGASVRDDGAKWAEPKCLGRINLHSKLDPNKIDAWADACYQHGTLGYLNQTGWHAALKQWQTCATTDADGLGYDLTGCTMRFAPPDGPAQLIDWDDWSPKGTVNQNPCTSLTLSVTVAGIGGSLVLGNFCETLNPVKGEGPLDFQANWSGAAPSHQSRDTGDIIAIHNHLNSGLSYRVYYGGISLHL